MTDNIYVRPATEANRLKVATHQVGTQDNAIHYPVYENLFLSASRGDVAGHSFIHKFGANVAVGTTLVPICFGGNYRTPTSVATLAVVSTSANDTADGTGAREITIVYLDADFNEQTGTIATNGLTESTETISGVIRVLRAWVSSSGSYANQTTSSQKGAITIQEAGAGDAWGQIPEVSTGFGAGQSLIGAYTVPAGCTAYVVSTKINVDSNKSVDMYFFSREGANTTSAPFPAIRLQNIYAGIKGAAYFDHISYESHPEYTDIGFMGKTASGTASVSVEFEMLIVQNVIP